MLVSCALFAGCTSLNTHVADKNRDVAQIRRVFVLSNLKDNHGIDTRIVRALKARGLEAESGPLTLLPDSAQAVIGYEDRWAWDFSDHMVYLKLGIRDPQAVFPYRTTTYQKQVAFSTRVDEVVEQVVGELFGPSKLH